MTVNNELIDQLLKDYQKPENILGDGGSWDRHFDRDFTWPAAPCPVG